jgi:hypothetical protein
VLKDTYHPTALGGLSGKPLLGGQRGEKRLLHQVFGDHAALDPKHGIAIEIIPVLIYPGLRIRE